MLFLLMPRYNPEGPIQNRFDDYNVCVAMVVRAENEEQARQLAQQGGGAECDRDIDGYCHTSPWTDTKLTTCMKLTHSGHSEVIIRQIS